MSPGWIVINYIVCFFEMGILFKFLAGILEMRFNKMINLISVALVAGMTNTANIIGMEKLWVVGILYGLIFLWILISFSGDVFAKAMAFGVFFMLNLAIESIVVFAMIYGTGASMTELLDYNGYRLVATIISKIMVYLFVIYYLEKKNKNPYSVDINLKMSLKLIALVFLIIGIMANMIQIHYSDGFVEFNFYFMVIGFAGVCILAISIYENMLKESEKQMELKLLLQQKKIEDKYNSEILANMQNMKYLRHDIQNHISAISGYVENRNYDRAKEYLSNLYEPIKKFDEVLHDESPVVSSIVFNKKVLAESKGIEFKADILIDKKINIEDMDIAILIGNILDNAIEACQRKPEGKKHISLNIRFKKMYLLVECANSMEPSTIQKQYDRFFTAKKDKNLHGLGLLNIQKVIDKYKGELRISLQEEKFLLNAVLLNERA
jgi:sensor histidine kinase YesM